jgi:molybdopterin-guanine dinucleotide biosynthesis adapter protein
MIPVISFVGNSGCGKTTYLVKLIGQMKSLGYKVAVIKHDVHGFEMDRPGKDTWRHAQAGADVVCISSPRKVAMIEKVGQERTLAEVAERISGVDIIFTEGYKLQGKIRIEVFRREVCGAPVCREEDLLASVSDVVLYPDLPCFPLDDPAPLAAFLEARMGLKKN